MIWPFGAGQCCLLASAGLCGQGLEPLLLQELSHHHPNVVSRYKMVPEAIHFLLDTYKQSLMVSMAYCYFYILFIFQAWGEVIQVANKLWWKDQFQTDFCSVRSICMKTWHYILPSPEESSANAPGQHLFLKHFVTFCCTVKSCLEQLSVHPFSSYEWTQQPILQP